MGASISVENIQKIGDSRTDKKKCKSSILPLTKSTLPTTESKPVTDLPESYPLERNILGIPIYVLHPKAAEKFPSMSTSWDVGDGKVEFTFVRGVSPFPIPQHAMIFDILLGMFARNWRADGVLYFSFSDVLRAAGKNPTSVNGRKCIEETILRYRRCSAQFEKSWYNQGRLTTWNGHFITETDIWDLETGKRTLKRNPRNAQGVEHYHMLRFSEKIVESLRAKHYRIFYKHSLALKPDAYLVFRYFYGFGDRNPIHRTLAQLREIFLWTGQASRFKPWLEKRLNDCKEHGYIQWFEIKKTSVTVKCKKLSEKPEIKRQAATVIDVSEEQREYDDSELLNVYLEAKAKGRVDDDTIASLDTLILAGTPSTYNPCIRRIMHEWGYGPAK